MADSTAMTIDFLRARLLSERSVSRAAKDRADQLAMRVAELEEQVRTVTAQRRQAERAAAEVLAILESQGFGGHLSEVVDSGSDNNGEEEEEPRDAKSGGDTVRSRREEQEPAAVQGEAEDVLSGTVQPGGLSWKGRSTSPRKARQLKQKHRRSYFYFLSSDSSPKYRMGLSCRKNKRKQSATPEEEAGKIALLAESQKGQQDGSDCTDDDQADLDDEVGGGEQSSGDGGDGQYVIRYEKDAEMERVLERQAELIGQYEAQEEAQREWEKQFNENRNSSKGDLKVENKAYHHENDRGASCDVEAKSSDKNLPSTSNRSAGCLPNGSLSESPQNASEQGAAQQRDEAHEEHDHGSALTAAVSAHGSSGSSTVTRQNQDQGDEDSDGYSSCHTNARSSRRHCAIKAPSDGSPSSDTLNSKVSGWSSSHFHDRTDNQQDVGTVLDALRRAKMSLREKLSRPLPPSQLVTLALPAPGDDRTEEDFPVDDGYNSAREEICSSSPSRQAILALPAPEDYREAADLPANDADISLAEKPSSSSPPRQEILALPAPGDDYQSEVEDDMKIPVCTPGLFRLPTDSFSKDEMLSVAPSIPRDDPGSAARQYCDPDSSVLLSAPTSAMVGAVTFQAQTLRNRALLSFLEFQDLAEI